MQVLRDHIDNKIGYLKDYMDTKLSTKEEVGKIGRDLAKTKADLIKWMFLFWVGQVAATFGFILLFLKK